MTLSFQTKKNQRGAPPANPIQMETLKRKRAQQCTNSNINNAAAKKKNKEYEETETIESVNLTFEEQSNLKAALAFVVLRRRLLGRQTRKQKQSSSSKQTANDEDLLTNDDEFGLEFLLSNPTAHDAHQEDEQDDQQENETNNDLECCNKNNKPPLSLKSSTRRHHIDSMMQCAISSTRSLYTAFTQRILKQQLQALSGVGTAPQEQEEDGTSSTMAAGGLLYDSHSVSLDKEQTKGSIHKLLDGMAYHLVIQLRSLRGGAGGRRRGAGGGHCVRG